jgi:hypothetical protein
MRVGSRATAKWERKGRHLDDCQTAGEWGTVWKRSKWNTDRTGEHGLREGICVCVCVRCDRITGWWVTE